MNDIVEPNPILESFASMSLEEQAIILIAMDKQASGEMQGLDLTVTTEEFEAKLMELKKENKI